jgi:selenocysteine lyase/cysteine desulfurase
MITPIGPNASGAIGVFGVDGMDMAKLGGWLNSKHNVITTPMVNDEFNGMRITPSVYTTVDEIDLFADRVTQAIKQGLA